MVRNHCWGHHSPHSALVWVRKGASAGCGAWRQNTHPPLAYSPVLPPRDWNTCTAIWESPWNISEWPSIEQTPQKGLTNHLSCLKQRESSIIANNEKILPNFMLTRLPKVPVNFRSYIISIKSLFHSVFTRGSNLGACEGKRRFC